MKKKKTVQVEVEIYDFVAKLIGIRKVDIPEGKVGSAVLEEDLQNIFMWGQNEIQEREFPSLSVGHVIRYVGKRFLIKASGFQELEDDEDSPGMLGTYLLT